MKIKLYWKCYPNGYANNSKKVDFGDELDAAKAEAKAWKTIWSAGQGVTTIEDDPTVKELVDSLKKEFISSINEQKDLLDTYK